MRAEQYAKLTEEQKAQYIKNKNEERKKNRKAVSVEFNLVSDEDILAWLDTKDNKSTAVKTAIREYLSKHKNECPAIAKDSARWDR